MGWLTHFIPGMAPDGAPIMSVLGKKTYRFANGKDALEDQDEQFPFTEADEYWGQGNPATDAVKLESDLVAYKPMTDVVFIAHAHAPRGKPVPMLDVGVQVGTARKIFRVFGDRKVFITGTGIAFTPPVPFERMPLDYGHAYGGKDEKSDEGIPYTYMKNPVGKGFVVKNNTKALQDLILPNLEDSQKLLTPQNLVLQNFDRWMEYPDPMGIGFTSKGSYPRYTLAGLSPDQQASAEMERQRAIQKMPSVGSGSAQPPPPSGILNLQFFNGASKGLSFPYLSGNEPIKMANLDRDKPQFGFNLPGDRPKAWLNVGEGKEELKMVLQSVVIYKQTNQLALVWRGSAYYGGIDSMQKFTRLEFEVKS
jgi:hypothetical protein